MFTVGASSGIKTSVMPESWKTYLDMEDGTQLTGYSKFAKKGDVYAFSDPTFVSGGLGQIKVLSGDMELATLTSAVEGENIGEFVWLTNDNEDTVSLDGSTP